MANDAQAGGPGGFWWFSGLDRGARHGVREGVLEAEGPRFALSACRGMTRLWMAFRGPAACRGERGCRGIGNDA